MKGNIMEKEILTIKEAASLITISVGTLYNWRSAGVVKKEKRYERNYILEIRDKWIKNELIV